MTWARSARHGGYTDVGLSRFARRGASLRGKVSRCFGPGAFGEWRSLPPMRQNHAVANERRIAVGAFQTWLEPLQALIT
jgi:hypothetical protein